MFFNKINMNTVRKNNMPGMQTDIRMEIKKKKINNWLSNKMTNEYIYVYINDEYCMFIYFWQLNDLI